MRNTEQQDPPLSPPGRAGSPPARRRTLALAAGVSLVLALALAPAAPAQDEEDFDDPFAESQTEQSAAVPAEQGMPLLVVSGFVDVGYIRITQDKPSGPLLSLGWADGNSQGNFTTETDTFTVNEVDLTLRAERTQGDAVIGALASIDYYPSRGEAMRGDGDRAFQVDQAFVFSEWREWWRTRLRLGRAPGVVTLEQLQGSESPESPLIGHTYVFSAAGGYPYGLQLRVEPLPGLALHLGHSNGGLGDYSFVPHDRSTTNRPVASDEDAHGDAQAEGKTTYGTIDWTVYDRPSDLGILRVGVAAAENPELTLNRDDGSGEPYRFSNVFLGYQYFDLNFRLERAHLEAYYADSAMGAFEADMTSALLGYQLAPVHLLTARYELMTFSNDRQTFDEGEAEKMGLTYRYQVGDPMVLKLEYVQEVQSPQFWRRNKGSELTTEVWALSWVYAY